MTSFQVEAVAPEHLPGIHALFEASSSTCFCRWWHFGGTKNDWLDRCANRPEENRAELDAAVVASAPEGGGLVALEGNRVVGWMKLTARAVVPKLRGLSVYRSLDLGDDATTFSIGCLLVHPDARSRGVARALIASAPTFAEAWGGGAIEAYPRRSTTPLSEEEAWHGPERAYVAAGYTAVHDVGPYPVYRMRLPRSTER